MATGCKFLSLAASGAAFLYLAASVHRLSLAASENSERKQEKFVCVECGLKSDEIYKEFKGGSFKLCICKFCRQRVDKYVEFDTVLVFLDIILHKIQAYRHLVFNKPPKIYWQLGIIYLLCDSYIKWYNVKHKGSHEFGTITDFSVLEMQFYFMFLLSNLETIVFLLAIFVALRIYVYWSKLTVIPRYGDILRVLLLSSFGKLLAFPAVVWGQTHSAVYLGLTRLFIFTSNVVALKVLFGKTFPAIFIITVGNGLMYGYIATYETMQFHEYLVP